MLRKSIVMFCFLFIFAAPALAQRADLGGSVSDQSGATLPDVEITVISREQGLKRQAVTASDGRFLVPLLPPGAYDVLAVREGFAPYSTEVTLGLGENAALAIRLQLATLQETVTVDGGDASSTFSPINMGTGANIGNAVVAVLPTIARSIHDLVRINPLFVQLSDTSGLSVAGRGGRYNNLQIDGSVSNDVFGVVLSGTPGGFAETQPISFDAVRELQLVVSPYDVGQSGFSGGGVNVVTRSGTNRLAGTGYYYFRDQSLVGTGVDRRAIATFEEKQFGGSVGGPLRKNAVFLFGNLELGRKATPAGFSADGTSGQAFGRPGEAGQILAIARDRYGYDPGGLSEQIRRTDNQKYFLRGDANVSGGQLTVRHNRVDALNDIGPQTAASYRFPNNFYRTHSSVQSSVVQWNGVWRRAVNELRASVQRIHDYRDVPARFPQVTVRLPDGGRYVLGAEPFSSANEIKQDIVELHDHTTVQWGSHTVTFGTHNELLSFSNLFIRDNFGTYEFANIPMFAEGLAQDFSYSFSRTADPRQAAKFRVSQLGAYAGDQWRLSDALSVTYGFRFDAPIFPATPAANPQVEALYGRRTDVTPRASTWSPRAGFNWSGSAEGLRQQLRGGIGVFAGRPAYVWLGNQYLNTGSEYTRLSTGFDTANRIPFVADPDAQPRTVGRAASNEINLIDDSFTFPRQLRGNLAYDRGLPVAGLVGTVEWLWAQTLADIDYQNLNLTAAGSQPDGRPIFRRTNPTFSDVMLLTRTREGNSWSLITTLERPFRGRWFLNGSYLYGRSRAVNDGLASQARSNWLNAATAGDPSAIPVATSSYDPKQRVTFAGAYKLPVGGMSLTLSGVYSGQAGRPFSYTFSNDVNGDGGPTNDLLYFPSRPDEVVVTNGTFDDLRQAFRSGCVPDPGAIAERNACRAPWTHGLDMRTALDFAIRGTSVGVTFDLLNVLNLFDRSAGLVEIAGSGVLSPVAATVGPDGRYIYDVAAITAPGGLRLTRDDLRSRWQAQVGMRVQWGR